MKELRPNPVTGKLEIPGEPTIGRVYKIVDLMTGEVGYNCATTDLAQLEERTIKMIEGYDTFRGWVTDLIPKDEVYATVKKLNKKKEFIDTPHTQMVARVRERLSSGNMGDIDGVSAIDDMREMHADILGRRERPPLPGWERR